MSGGDWPVAGLLERTRELSALSGLLGDARAGRGQCALVEGPAGIGKSSVLEECAEHASEDGFVVLRARGDEVAMESPFATVRELLWRHVQSVGPDAFEGAARMAAPIFDGEPDSGDDQGRVATVLHGLYWLVADLAEREPLAIFVDDAHWLDPASARFLVYLARRIDSLPVLLALAARRGGASGVALSGSATTVLKPDPLSEAAAELLVRGELGPRADEELGRSCHAATGGNPFYLRALAAALRAEDERPTIELAERVRSLGAGAIGRTVLVRLAGLGGDCERLAQALAVLGPATPLRLVAGLAELDRELAATAADRLRDADLLAATQPLTFIHPIVNEAVSAELPTSRRATLHGSAARLLAEDGAPADRIAAHLLSAEPFGETWVVEQLRAAARIALGHGAPESAVSYLRRALAEPPADELRLEVMLELGRAEALLPVSDDFGSLREALKLSRDSERRAQIALELALHLSEQARSSDVVAVLEEVLRDASILDPSLVDVIESVMLGGGGQDLPSTQRLLDRMARHFARARRGEVEDPLMLAGLGLIGAVTSLTGPEAADLIRLALRDGRLLQFTAALGATAALAWADELDEAAQVQDAAIADSQRRGSAPMFMHMSVFRSDTALRAGQLDIAEDHGQRAYELALQLGSEPFAVMFYVPVLLERGRIADALSLVDSIQLDARQLRLWQGVIVLAQRGRVRVALGELEPGLADMEEADRRMAEGACHLSVLADWVPTAVFALRQLGRRDDAVRLAQRELAEAIAYRAPRRHGIALSVCGSADDGPQGMGWLHEAVSVLERSPARLEHARALVNLGAGLLARGRRAEARSPLAEGLDLANRCGATSLAERARGELIASGARPRRASLRGPEALTPAELRAARMASQGLSNREIAQALFVSSKTVEAQLSLVYAKLGISGRTELGESLTVA